MPRPESGFSAALLCGATLCAIGCNANATSPAGGSAGSPDRVVEQVAPPAFAPVRRLTHVEYDNTVADLLGDTTAPADKFTADVSQDGFTNNARALSVSPALTEQYLAAATTLSQNATTNLTSLLGCDGVAAEQTCVQQFIRDFGKRAWRRPLTPDEQSRLLSVFSAARADDNGLELSLQMLLQVLLQAPQFIYLLEPSSLAAGSVAPLDSWQVAARLSYFLLGSTMPDAELFAEAEKDALKTPEQVDAQAWRLLQTQRARERIGLFFEEWMQLRNVDRMQKDPVLFPNYTLDLGPLLQQQVRLYATDVILDQGGTVADLLTAPYTFMTPELAPLYGVPPTPPGFFTRVDLDPAFRAGIFDPRRHHGKPCQGEPNRSGPSRQVRARAAVVPDRTSAARQRQHHASGSEAWLHDA
jgi:hypothetical protein